MDEPTATGSLSQLLELMSLRNGKTASQTGLQGAHIYGNNFVEEEAQWRRQVGCRAACKRWLTRVGGRDDDTSLLLPGVTR